MDYWSDLLRRMKLSCSNDFMTSALLLAKELTSLSTIICLISCARHSIISWRSMQTILLVSVAESKDKYIFFISSISRSIFPLFPVFVSVSGAIVDNFSSKRDKSLFVWVDVFKVPCSDPSSKVKSWMTHKSSKAEELAHVFDLLLSLLLVAELLDSLWSKWALFSFYEIYSLSFGFSLIHLLLWSDSFFLWSLLSTLSLFWPNFLVALPYWENWEWWDCDSFLFCEDARCTDFGVFVCLVRSLESIVKVLRRDVNFSLSC